MNSLVQSSDHNGVRIIELLLPDVIDPVLFSDLNDELRSAIDAQNRIVIDLSSTSYVGSAILGLLVNVRQIVKQANGRLILCGLSPRLQQIFETSSLQRLFMIALSRPDALRAMP